MTQPEQFLRLSEAAALIGVTAKSLHGTDNRRNKGFPAPVRPHRWRKSDVVKWWQAKLASKETQHA